MSINFSTNDAMDTMNIEAKKWLKQKRKSYNLTQEQVALQLGISLTAYRDMETGKTIIINPTFIKAAEIIGADPKEILGKQSFHNTKETLTNIIDALKDILNDIQE